MSYQFGHVDPEERLGVAEAPEPGDDYPPRRRLPAVLLVVGVAAAFAGGLWFAYHQGTKHATVAVNSPAGSAAAPSASAPENSVPLIRADTDPVKVKPEKAGGMNIPNKDDPLYALRPGTTPAEHILPPPEAPQPRPVAPPPPPPPAQAMTQAPAPSTAFPPPLPAPSPNGAVPKAAPKPGDAAKPTDAAKPAAAGPPTKIQLASLRTPDEARDEWQRLKRDNDDLLGKLTAVAVRTDLGDRGIWYRVEVGPVGDKAAAAKLCKALKERDLGCQLVP
jgi:hypothetical protein